MTNVDDLQRRLRYLAPDDSWHMDHDTPPEYPKTQSVQNDYDQIIWEGPGTLPTVLALEAVSQEDLTEGKKDKEFKERKRDKNLDALVEWIGSLNGMDAQQAENSFKPFLKSKL